MGSIAQLDFDGLFSCYTSDMEQKVAGCLCRQNFHGKFFAGLSGQVVYFSSFRVNRNGSNTTNDRKTLVQ